MIKSQLQSFLYHTLCVLTNVSNGTFIMSPGSCPRVGLWVLGSKIFASGFAMPQTENLLTGT